jgi:hypothetical protein
MDVHRHTMQTAFAEVNRKDSPSIIIVCVCACAALAYGIILKTVVSFAACNGCHSLEIYPKALFFHFFHH